MEVLAAKRSSMTVTLMAVVILASMATNTAVQVPLLTCAMKLISCQNYINSTNPPEECCKPLKDAVTNDLSCLCDIFNNLDTLKSFGIDINQALKLPVNCGIVNDTSNLCNSTWPPWGSPGNPGAPPATPGNGSNDASKSTRVDLWGIASLFFIWWGIFA